MKDPPQKRIRLTEDEGFTTFLDLFDELLGEVGERCEVISRFMLSHCNRRLWKIFHTKHGLHPPLGSTLNIPAGSQLGNNFITNLVPQRPILSRPHYRELIFIIASDWRHMFDYLIKDCGWTIDMTTLIEVSMGLIHLGFLSYPHVHSYIEYKVVDVNFNASYGSISATIPYDAFAQALGEAGSIQQIQYIVHHYDRILGTLSRHHLNFLHGAIIYDHIHIFKQCSMDTPYTGSVWGIDWRKFFESFVLYDAPQCLLHFIKTTTPEIVNGLVDYVLNSVQWTNEPAPHVRGLFRTLMTTNPYRFNVWSDFARNFANRSPPARQLLIYILSEHPIPLGNIRNLDEFKDWLARMDYWNVTGRRYHTGWYGLVKSYLPEEWRDYYDQLARANNFPMEEAITTE